MRWWICWLLLSLAGCLGDTGESDLVLLGLDESSPFQATVPAPGDPPSLANLSRQDLIDNVATFHVPAGQWAIVRNVLTMDMWGEQAPWDGESSFQWAISITGTPEHEATLVRVTQGVSFVDAGKYEARSSTVRVFPLEGGHAWYRESSEISFYGDGASDRTPPRDEPAWIVGSATSDLDVRVAMFAENFPREFPDRPAVPITVDARGWELDGGIALYEWDSSGGLDGVSVGALSLEDSGAAAQFVDHERVLRLSGVMESRHPATLFAKGTIQGTYTIDQWRYRIDTPGGGVQDEGEKSPLSPESAPAHFSLEAEIPAGILEYEMESTFTGFGATPWTHVKPAVAGLWAHVSVDFEELYGWPQARLDLTSSSESVPGTLRESEP